MCSERSDNILQRGLKEKSCYAKRQFTVSEFIIRVRNKSLYTQFQQ